MPSFPDDDFLLYNVLDQTKWGYVDLAGATTGTQMTLKYVQTANREVTYPDGNCILAGKDLAQTWTAEQTLDSDAGGFLLFLQTPGSGIYGFQYKDVVSGFVVGLDLSAQTVGDAQIIIPNLAGVPQTMVLTTQTQTLSNKTITTLKNSSTSQGIPVVAGNGADPPAANAIGKITRTGQSVAIAATNLTNATPAGLYLVHYYLECTTADAVELDTVNFQISYTDTVGATSQTSANLAVTATTTGTTAVKGSFVVKLVSGNITYQTNLSGSLGATAKYALAVRCEFLG